MLPPLPKLKLEGALVRERYRLLSKLTRPRHFRRQFRGGQRRGRREIAIKAKRLRVIRRKLKLVSIFQS